MTVFTPPPPPPPPPSPPTHPPTNPFQMSNYSLLSSIESRLKSQLLLRTSGLNQQQHMYNNNVSHKNLQKQVTQVKSSSLGLEGRFEGIQAACIHLFHSVHSTQVIFSKKITQTVSLAGLCFCSCFRITRGRRVIDRIWGRWVIIDNWIWGSWVFHHRRLDLRLC